MWSDSAYLLVGSAPQSPQTPLLVSFGETQITLLVALSLNDYGSPIQSYQLYVNQGSNGSPFLQITNYNGQNPTYQLIEGQVIGSFKVFVGGLYRFKTIAVNSIGSSGFSNELVVALAALPLTPSPTTFNTLLSNRVQNVLQWSEGISIDIAETGYQLFSDNGLPGNMFLIYDGS